MKKLIPVFAITVILLSQAIVASYGKGNNGQSNVQGVKTEVKQNNGNAEIKVQDLVEEDTEENELIEENNENKNRVKFLEKKDGEFKIWGTIQSFTSSSITIDGKTINYDTDTKIVGIIAVGKYAKVEGDNAGDTMTAEEIVVDNRNKVTPTASIAISPTTFPSISVTPTVTESITPTPIISGPTATETPSVTPSETPVATETPTLQTSNDAFIIDRLVLNFENLLRSLFRFSR